MHKTFSPKSFDLKIARLWKFVKELVILFHRISADPWGHVVSTIKRAPSEDSSFFVFNSLLQISRPTPAICVFICKNCNTRFICNYMGILISPEKPGLFLRFCKRINRSSTAVGRWVTAFERKELNDFLCNKIYIQQTINNKHQMEQTTNM